MAVAFRAAGTELNLQISNTAGQAISTPASVAVGEILVTLIVNDANTYPTAPSGWTTLGEVDNGTSSGSSPFRPHTSVYYRVADGTEGSSQTWSFNTSAYPTGDANVKAIMFAFTGGHTTTPIQGSEWSTSTTTATTSALTHPSVTPGVNGCGLILFRGAGVTANRTFTSSVTSASAPAGVERWDTALAGASTDSCAYTRDGSFGTGAQSFTTTSSNTCIDGSVLWSILIRPAATVTNASAEHVAVTATSGAPTAAPKGIAGHVAATGTASGPRVVATANASAASVAATANGVTRQILAEVTPQAITAYGATIRLAIRAEDVDLTATAYTITEVRPRAQAVAVSATAYSASVVSGDAEAPAGYGQVLSVTGQSTPSVRVNAAIIG
jgi:hypothetical protein